MTTGVHETLPLRKRHRYIDRWLVFLVLYVALYFALRSAIANAAGDGDLIDAVQSSGPVMGSVLILAFVIKAWVTDLKGTVNNLQTKIETLSGTDNGLSAKLVTLEADLRDALRRIDRLERRSSGTHPRGE